ncbi:hypothetical protein [Paenibacillus sp. J2TS4]|uniref:hypothetical protein n=1 Tax=Paenibacillus sp. J2TS4 TaxID=2807194 RepID=UPI001B0FD353|nr:hypothetical protein [Paenibacillus sp. J2TS4]GIP36306.1 hypothetical protein J2TS4_55160 [Paenibacillus sp. J2TS4]
MNKGLSKEATIYNYALLKKCGLGKIYSSIYIILLLVWGIVGLMWHYSGTITLLLGLPVFHYLYYILIRLLIRFTSRTAEFTWVWKKDLLWNGYLPESYIRIQRLLSIHLHLLVIGTAIIGIAYVWVPGSVFFTLLYIHCWLLLPRIGLLLKLKKINSTGLVKISGNELSLYST